MQIWNAMKTEIFASIFILGISLVFIAGCTWDPEHDNPLDPDHYSYVPKGLLEVHVLSSADEHPLSNAEVRIDSLGILGFTNLQGSVQFEFVPVGRYKVTAQKMSPETGSYKLDSLFAEILENVVSRDTFKLDSLPPEPDSLYIQVLTKDRRYGIADATVQVPEYGRSTLTNSEGWAYFNDLPVGETWVIAFKNINDTPIYAMDSIHVILDGSPREEPIILDALPQFTDTDVLSITIQKNREVREQQIHLKAWVEDPDGESDLDRVEWSFKDISGELSYNLDPDSSFWEILIPSESFPNGIGEAIENPFEFIAYDDEENSTPVQNTLRNIIQEPAILEAPNIDENSQEANFSWFYYWRNWFADVNQFYYMFNIYKPEPGGLQTVFDTLIYSNGAQDEAITLPLNFEPSTYECYLWVIDNFGNYARSRTQFFTIAPDTSEPAILIREPLFQKP